jgi:hypothetical protein
MECDNLEQELHFKRQINVNSNLQKNLSKMQKHSQLQKITDMKTDNTSNLKIT